MEKRIENLKEKTKNYINAGGSIYDPKRKLPYYEDLQYIVKILRKKTGKKVSSADIYKLCGFDFDKDFDHFMTFRNELKKFVGKNGTVDTIKSKDVKSVNNVYSKLKSYTEKYNTNPFDFLVLMTGYRLDECSIKTNAYIDIVKNEILKVYPNGDITGIRHANPHLYEKLQHIRKTYNTSMKEIIELLGLTMNKASTQKKPSINKAKLVQDLFSLYPDGKIENLINKNIYVYRKLIKACNEEYKTTAEWCHENGFLYSEAKSVRRLGKITVDATARQKLLLELKRTALQKYKPEQLANASEIQLFHISLNSSIEVINFLNTHQEIQTIEDLENHIQENTI